MEQLHKFTPCSLGSYLEDSRIRLLNLYVLGKDNKRKPFFKTAVLRISVSI